MPVKFKDELVSPRYLRNALDYDPDTGLLRWKYRGDMPAAWNARYVGTPAFQSKEPRGYLAGRIHRSAYRTHRVVWAIVHGEWPVGYIDHINGDRSDNRIANLRVVNASENRRNSAMPERNTSGCIGVTWNKQCGKWQAQMKIQKKPIYLGVYENFEEAVAARKAAEKQYGFHSNHGRAALAARGGRIVWEGE